MYAEDTWAELLPTDNTGGPQNNGTQSDSSDKDVSSCEDNEDAPPEDTSSTKRKGEGSPTTNDDSSPPTKPKKHRKQSKTQRRKRESSVEISDDETTSTKKTKLQNSSLSAPVSYVVDAKQICSSTCKVCVLLNDTDANSEFATFFHDLYNAEDIDSVYSTKKLMLKFSQIFSEIDRSDIMTHFNLSRAKWKKNIFRKMSEVVHSGQMKPADLIKYYELWGTTSNSSQPQQSDWF